MIKYLTSFSACVLVLLGLIGIRIYDPDIIQQLRVINFDYYQKNQESVLSDSVILLDISEYSLSKQGQFPWPRQEYAQMISDLRKKNAGIIGFTIMFPEPDRFGGDDIFSSWISQNGIVLSQAPSTKGLSSSAPHVGTAILGEGNPTDFAYSYNSVVTNIPELSEEAWGSGMNSSAPEVDSTVRRIPLVNNVNGKIYPSFGLEVVRVMSDKLSYTMKVEETGIENIRIPPFDPVKTDYTGSVWIDWSVDFERYEYERFMRDIKDFNGKSVIIGVTAEGVQPLIPTPKGLKLPHEIQGSLIHTLTGGKQISRPQWTSLVEISVILISSVLLLLSVYYLPIWFSGLFFGSSLVGVIWTAFSTWSSYGILIDYSYFLMVFILVFSHSSFNNFYKQFKLKQQIKGQFGTYLSPDMVDILVKDPSLMKLGGDRKDMTFMFADIVGFTPISESYMKKDDPEGLVELINLFLDRLTKIILKNGGTIDKYMGDCIMAFWNAPLPCENHAHMAVQTAIEMELECDKLNKELEEQGLDLPLVKIGTGINTGRCIVGNMGSESRFDYSVVGDAVNLGARLEVQTREYDTPILISEYTYMKLTDISCKELDIIKVKGKEEPVKIYAPLFQGEMDKLVVRKLYKD